MAAALLRATRRPSCSIGTVVPRRPLRAPLWTASRGLAAAAVATAAAKAHVSIQYSIGTGG
jgi:hypothetical protein